MRLIWLISLSATEFSNVSHLRRQQNFHLQYKKLDLKHTLGFKIKESYFIMEVAVMQYRTLGRTQLQVSEIGLGCEGLSDQDGALAPNLLDAAAEAGINYIDYYVPNPQVRDITGQSLKGRREKFLLQGHLCSVWRQGQYQRTREIGAVQNSFMDLLKRLQTDYVDVGMIHYVDALADWQQVSEGPILAYAQKQKEAGSIRFLGLSSHNPQVAIKAAQSGLIDVIMFSVNPCYDLQPAGENVEELWNEKNYAQPLLNMDAERQSFYETCQRLGVGITVMKAFGGGDLLNAELSPAGRALTVNQCLHYALTRPAVASVLVGAHSVEQLQQCLAYENASAEEKDYAAALANFPNISWQGHCMYCGHCAPCPQQIDIATVTKFYHLAQAQDNIPETVREHYALLPQKAGDCIQCGACESRCPFGVAIRQNMRQAQTLFGR